MSGTEQAASRSDGIFVGVLLLLSLGYLATDNILQEIEVAVLACLVVLAYIAIQLRLWKAGQATKGPDAPPSSGGPAA